MKRPVTVRASASRRVARVLVGLLITITAIIFFAALIYWPRSYRVSDGITWNYVRMDGATKVTHWGLWTARGRLIIYRLGWAAYRTDDAPPLPTWEARRVQVIDAAAIFPGYDKGVGMYGFRFVRGFWGDGSGVLHVPLWAIATVSGIPLFWWAVRWRRARVRRRKGLCPACGYDLRASHGKCPECGQEIAAKPPEVAGVLTPS